MLGGANYCIFWYQIKAFKYSHLYKHKNEAPLPRENLNFRKRRHCRIVMGSFLLKRPFLSPNNIHHYAIFSYTLLAVLGIQVHDGDSQDRAVHQFFVWFFLVILWLADSCGYSSETEARFETSDLTAMWIYIWKNESVCLSLFLLMGAALIFDPISKWKSLYCSNQRENVERKWVITPF